MTLGVMAKTGVLGDWGVEIDLQLVPCTPSRPHSQPGGGAEDDERVAQGLSRCIESLGISELPAEDPLQHLQQVGTWDTGHQRNVRKSPIKNKNNASNYSQRALGVISGPPGLSHTLLCFMGAVRAQALAGWACT